MKFKRSTLSLNWNFSGSFILSGLKINTRVYIFGRLESVY